MQSCKRIQPYKPFDGLELGAARTLATKQSDTQWKTHNSVSYLANSLLSFGETTRTQIQASVADQPTLARWRTFSLLANCRCRLAARNRPSSRPPVSLFIRTPHISGVQPRRVKVSTTSDEIAAFPSRSIRPVYSINIKYRLNEKPSRIPSRTDPRWRRSSIGDDTLTHTFHILQSFSAKCSQPME